MTTSAGEAAGEVQPLLAEAHAAASAFAAARAGGWPHPVPVPVEVIACGNTCIVTPSEKVPLTMRRVFDVIGQTGLPKSVLNLVNGAAARKFRSEAEVGNVPSRR